jgi:DNA-binding transcriptional MocR family regulator
VKDVLPKDPGDMGPDDPRQWVQIASDLRRRMDDGTLSPDEQPSITYECGKWGVARQTVAKAMLLLEREGRLKRYPGIGYVVLPPQPRQRQRQLTKLRRLLRLGKWCVNSGISGLLSSLACLDLRLRRYSRGAERRLSWQSSPSACC